MAHVNVMLDMVDQIVHSHFFAFINAYMEHAQEETTLGLVHVIQLNGQDQIVMAVWLQFHVPTTVLVMERALLGFVFVNQITKVLTVQQ
jgi:hypothetical protein